MNLDDLINYKIDCPICSSKLLIDCKTLKTKLYLENNALLLKTKSNEIRLFFDGGYESANKPTHRNLKIARQCVNCMYVPNFNTLNRKFGISGMNTLGNLNVPKYFYLFNVELKKTNKTQCGLIYESFHYSDGDKFYGINVNFLENKTGIIIGDSKQIVDKITLKEFDRIIDTSHIKTLDDLEKKIKLMMLFL